MIPALELDGLEAEEQCNSLVLVNGTVHTIIPILRVRIIREWIPTYMVASGTSIPYMKEVISGDNYMNLDLNSRHSDFRIPSGML